MYFPLDVSRPPARFLPSSLLPWPPAQLCSSSHSPSLSCLIKVFPCCFHHSFLIHSLVTTLPPSRLIFALCFLSFAHVKLRRVRRDSWDTLPFLLSSGLEKRRRHEQEKRRRRNRRKVVTHITGAGASFSGLSTGHPPPGAMTGL